MIQVWVVGVCLSGSEKYTLRYITALLCCENILGLKTFLDVSKTTVDLIIWRI